MIVSISLVMVCAALFGFNIEFMLQSIMNKDKKMVWFYSIMALWMVADIVWVMYTSKI